MEISIDRNVPIDLSLSWRHKLSCLNIEENSDFGDSLPVLAGSEETVRQTAYTNFHKFGERFFTVRRDPDDPANFRVWRVSKELFFQLRGNRRGKLD